MIENNDGSKQKYLLRLMVLLCLICLCLGCSASIPQSVMDPKITSEPNDVRDSEHRAREVAQRSASRSATSGFKSSLEMKENADFLLTPALLMQEVLSDEIITTYPSE